MGHMWPKCCGFTLTLPTLQIQMNCRTLKIYHILLNYLKMMTFNTFYFNFQFLRYSKKISFKIRRFWTNKLECTICSLHITFMLLRIN